MTSILCLAHFCEVHGPTPLMVTEGLPVKCGVCDTHGDVPDLLAAVTAAAVAVANQAVGTASDKTASAHAAADTAVATALQNMKLAPSLRSSSRSSTKDEDALPNKASATSAPRSATSRSPRPVSSTTLPSPPSYDTKTDSSSHFRKTYDDSVAKRAIPCDNCAMTLPRRKQDPKTANDTTTATANATANAGATKGAGATGATGASCAADSRNPTLRTRVPCARVYDGASSEAASQFLHPSPSVSSSSSDTESEDQPSSRYYGQNRQHHHRRSGTMTSTATSRSSASSGSRMANSHTHYLDYTSTHEPAAANAYYIIRASCLRTLTLETLPRSPASGLPNASGPGPMMQQSTPVPSSPFASYPHNAASASAAAAAAANGGPLFFGDPTAGYTTAHVFRVSDVHARGHKRVYAFIALSTHRERLAMKAFGFVSAAFHELASWIQQLADTEAERVALQSESGSGASSPATNAHPAGYAFNGINSQISPPPTQPSSVVSDSPASQGSSFLAAAGNGLSRRMGPGYAGFGGLGSSAVSSLRARGLPEILGKPDFFIELHARFVRLLLELGVMLSS